VVVVPSDDEVVVRGADVDERGVETVDVEVNAGVVVSGDDVVVLATVVVVTRGVDVEGATVVALVPCPDVELPVFAAVAGRTRM
jgi:hypothetical protein